MLKLAVVGTNWITDNFINGAREHEDVAITTVISRTAERGNAFREKYNFIKYHYTTVEEALLADKNGDVEIDAFYIASPDAMHFSQAKAALLSKKHALVEKPFTSNVAELEELYDIARKQNVVLMEAIKTIRLPIFKKLQEHINGCKQDMKNVSMYFGERCEQYDKYLLGEYTNLLSPEMSGSGLTDVGVYCIWAALELLGMPKKYTNTAELISTGTDICGKVVLEYDNFNVDIHYSKKDRLGIYLIFNHTGGTIMVPGFNNMSRFIDEKFQCVDTNDKQYKLYYELKLFYDIIGRNDYSKDLQELYEKSRMVMTILEDCRKQVGVKFAADEK